MKTLATRHTMERYTGGRGHPHAHFLPSTPIINNLRYQRYLVVEYLSLSSEFSHQ